MTISAVIPTINRHEDLLSTLKSVYEQTCLPDEIIIVDQNESSEIKNAVFSLIDGVDNLEKKNITLKYIHDSRITGLTQAKNRAIEENESDIVLFLDDDVILEEDFIFHMMKIYKKYPDIYGVSGIITNSSKEGRIGRVLYKYFLIGNFRDERVLVYMEPEKYLNDEYIAATKLSGGLTSYRKKVLEEFKFDENIIGYGLMEDYDFSFRVSRKYKLVMTPKARLEHLVSDSGRVDYQKLTENIILAMNYFLKKNLNKNIYNYLCYFWVNVGYIVNGILFVLFKKEKNLLIGYIKGLRKVFRSESNDYMQSTGKKD